MELSQEVIKSQWEKICSRIQKTEANRFAVRWLSKIVPDKMEGNQVCLLVPSPCIHELVQQNYADQILSLWQEQNADVTGLNLKLAATAQSELPLASPAVLKPAKILPELPIHEETTELLNVPQSLLNPKYTFSSFVVGPANQFATAVAHKIAEEEEIAFNPVYIHGASGLGKTHLMQAIVWKMKEMYPDKSVLFLSSEQFFLQFMQAMKLDKTNRMEGTRQFRDIFRSVDVLMIDDIQFLCGKIATQEEFCNTLNDLMAHGKQVIVSADSLPQEVRSMPDRLRTRISQGLVVVINPPSYETRLGILQEKMRDMAREVPADVLDFLARNITSNVRELEGALKRIVAHAELIGDPINIDTTKEVIKDLLRVSDKEITIKEILYAVCGHYQIGLSDLKSNRRERRLARPRQLAMYLSKLLTPQSLPDIGRAFERDHTTVMHAVSTIENLIERDARLAADADTLIRRLKGEVG